jgi:putative pyrroloquinoline-quinone-binding quinoprotein
MLWSSPILTEYGEPSSSPTIVNGVVYVGSGVDGTGQLYAFALPEG